jgi:hypothetical protein
LQARRRAAAKRRAWIRRQERSQHPNTVFEYATQAKAKEAHSLIAKAIEGPEITLAAAR